MIVPIGPGSGGILTTLAYMTFQFSGPDYPVPQTYQSNQLQNTNAANGGPLSVNFASGLNTIPVPTGASGFFFQLPRLNTVAVISQRGQSGDTGTHITPGGGFDAQSWDQNFLPTNIYFTAAAAVTGCELVWM